MDIREKRLMIIMVILIGLLIIKSFFMDPYEPSNSKEKDFFDEVEQLLVLSEDSWLYNYKIVTTRIVHMKPMTEKEKTVKGQDGEVYQATGIYKAKVRKYVFGLIPFSDKYILDVD